MKFNSTLLSFFFMWLSTSFDSLQASAATLSPIRNASMGGNENSNRDLQSLIADFDGQMENGLFGTSVAISGNGKVVAGGAPRTGATGLTKGYGSSGFVRVFEDVDGSFVQKGNDIDGDTENAEFGEAVELSMDGSILAAIEDYGFPLRVFEFVDGDWQQLGNTVEATSVIISLSISADGHAVVFGSDDGGEVYIYDYNEDSASWSQRGDSIVGNEGGDGFGRGVSISQDGSSVVAASPYGAATSAGYAKVFKFVGAAWTQIGSDIVGEGSEDRLEAVDIASNGTVVALGASRNNDENGSQSGHVRIYGLQNGEWLQIGQDIDGEGAVDFSGVTVSLSSDGMVVAIGAHQRDNANGTAVGQTRVYRYYDYIWQQVQSSIEGGSREDFSGADVALSGDGSTLVVGVPGYDAPAGSEHIGQVRVFRLDLSALSTNITTPSSAPTVTSVTASAPSDSPIDASGDAVGTDNSFQMPSLTYSCSNMGRLPSPNGCFVGLFFVHPLALLDGQDFDLDDLAWPL
eukprot:scaffold92_cov85-Cylindrotheca_fusiformis.AAC.6